MNEQLETVAVTGHVSIVVTTKFDLETFGRAISATLEPSKVGYMNFEGRRGLDALNSPVREIELPDVRNGVVDAVVIAKSCLATGCTAISLARTAVQEYSPRILVIATIFYSMSGLRELEEAFPHAHMFVVGEPDEMDGDGLLHPGVGLLEDRLSSKP
jgi:uracil phosphoribosyltransferase